MTIYVVVGEGGTHETLVAKNGGEQIDYQFQVFLKADELEEAVAKADSHLVAEGWQDIAWEKAGIIEAEHVVDEIRDPYDEAVQGRVAVLLYTLGQENDDEA